MIARLRKVAEDQHDHATDEWDDSELIGAAATKIERLMLENKGLREQIARYKARNP